METKLIVIIVWRGNLVWVWLPEMGELVPISLSIVAFLCTCGAIALAVIHIYRHLLNYTEPTYQRFIVRIIFMVPVSDSIRMTSAFDFNICRQHRGSSLFSIDLFWVNYEISFFNCGIAWVAWIFPPCDRLLCERRVATITNIKWDAY